MRLIEKRNLDAAAAIHYTAQDEMNLAVPLKIRAPGVVIPLGINTAEYGALPVRGTFVRSHPELIGKQLLVFMGRIVPKKGLDLLVESFAQLSRENPESRLIVAGSEEDGYGDYIRRLLREKGILDRTLFTGLVTGAAKLALLADADVWVLPSYSENFGLAVVEAMACGLPVVITDKVNIHREVAEQGAGRVVACNAGELTDSLRTLLNNPELRSGMGRKGRALAASRFSWETNVNALIESYEAILSNQNSPRRNARPSRLGVTSDGSRQSRPLAVLHVTPSLGPRLGGPSKAAGEMCVALASRGLKVSLFTTDLLDRGSLLPFRHQTSPSAGPQRLVNRGVEIREFRARWPSRYVFSPGLARQLRARMADFDIVHIHSLYLFSTLVAAHYARKFRIPYVIRPHGTLDPYMRKRHRIRKWIYTTLFERRNLDRAAAIHFTADDEMRLATPSKLRAPGVVVPLGVRSEEFSQLPRPGSFRDRHPALAGKRLIVFIGRIVPKKGLDILVEAFAQVAQEDAEIQLVLAGGDEDGYGGVIERLIRKKGLQNKTLSLGPTTGQDKLALLADTDIWVLPSYSENFGLGVVEAMACGLPVIITNRVNIHQEVTRAAAGLVVDCDSPQLAEAIRVLLRNPTMRKEMGARARSLVQSKFTWESTADKLINVYQAVVSGKPLDG